MSGPTMHLFRRAFGLVLALVGLAILMADVQVSYTTRQGLHIGHMVMSVLMIFAGGWCLNPPDAEAIADAIAKRVPVIRSIWPGGMRADDPPRRADVPPPPSVTGDHKS